MNNLNKLYQILICNKFNYLMIQIILFVLVLTLDSYDTPENSWGVSYILRVSLIMLCLLMIFRFVFLNYSPIFITFLGVLSCASIFYDEIISLFNLYDATQLISNFSVKNNVESIITILISALVIVSLISNQRESS